jgi:hypothetical protein
LGSRPGHADLTPVLAEHAGIAAGLALFELVLAA